MENSKTLQGMGKFTGRKASPDRCYTQQKGTVYIDYRQEQKKGKVHLTKLKCPCYVNYLNHDTLYLYPMHQ